MSTSSRPNSKSQVIILSLLHEGLTPTQTAIRFGVSRKWIYQLLARYRAGGLEALEPISRRPHTNPRSLSNELQGEITTLRCELLAKGLDAGAASIAWHLKQKHQHAPALSTIGRILKAEGLVTPQPKKRPRAYIQRFEAVQPNETWQGDFTHWRLADGSDVEIINWLDDHSRLLLHIKAMKAVTGPAVIASFNECRRQYGTPFSTLTDNGVVYTARFVKGKNGFEYLLSDLGVIQKNGSPGHPQTQGKIERFHQTLKKWLSQQIPASCIENLQQQLDEFRTVYNTQRPHRALEMKTPAFSYAATIKATPRSADAKEHYRLRYDNVDKYGKVSLRRAGKMHHLGVGRGNRQKRVIIIVDHIKVTVVEKSTGEMLSEHEINPSRSYWANIIPVSPSMTEDHKT